LITVEDKVGGTPSSPQNKNPPKGGFFINFKNYKMKILICKLFHKKYHKREWYGCEGAEGAKDYYITCSKCN
jgi:hypothetical protein